jgi:hypothetical protein
MNRLVPCAALAAALLVGQGLSPAFPVGQGFSPAISVGRGFSPAFPVGQGSSPASPAQSLPPPPWPTFTDITAESGVAFVQKSSPTPEKYLLETMGGGVAAFDADGDGRLDLYFVNGAHLEPGMRADAVPGRPDASWSNRFFRQRADGRFEEATEAAGLAGRHYGMGVAAGDYDNDGDADLYVTAYPSNILYRNDGRARFTDVTAEAGVAGSGWSTSAAFVDLDHDGRLDLFVARYMEWSFGANPWCGDRQQAVRAYCHPDMFKPVVPLVFRNDGHGRFSEAGEATGLARPAKALGVAVADYDRDGLVDVFVANDGVPEFLFRNLGGGRFEERAMAAGAAVDEDGRAFAGMGVDFTDYDNDGGPDIVVTALSNQMYALFRNANDGTFTYATHRTGMGRVTMLNAGWGLRFADLDNDGWKDLIVAQGHVLDTIEKTSPQVRYEQPPLALRNNGGRQFKDMSARSGGAFTKAWASRGLALGDLDNDGDLDFAISTLNGEAKVLRNDGVPGAHWIALRLTGTKSNRDAIGAVVRLVTADGRQQWQTVTRTSSYLSSADPRVHFGLGASTAINLAEIRWPSGAVQSIRNPRVDVQLDVTEP